MTIFGLGTLERSGARGWRFIRQTDALPAEFELSPDRTPALRRSDIDRSAHARTTDPRNTRRQVMNDAVFRTVLVRERKRADRSNHPFIVLLLSQSAVPVHSGWDEAIEALTAAKRDTDVLGWFEQGATIGLIVPDISADAPAVALDLESRVRGELVKRLDPRMASAIALQLHVHGVPEETLEQTGLWPVKPLLEKAVRREPGVRVQELFKRALDIAGSAVLLSLLSPLFLLIAALVKLKSPGPVFFKQTRVGEKARPFTMLKFRSMRVNADSAIHQQYVSWFITASDEEKKKAQGVFKLTNDPRITPIGNLLRKTSLDELPQLWNVLRGDMSLVGPRPPLEYEVQKYAPWHCRRVLEAKPGITGLWQVTGRSRTTFDEMVRLDLRYARKVSVWTDIKILLATPRAVIMGKGAC